jgi:hypothetical protein
MVNVIKDLAGIVNDVRTVRNGREKFNACGTGLGRALRRAGLWTTKK